MTSKKYLVISDLHGDSHCIAIIEQALKQHDIQEILCCGDILYHGPRNDLPQGYQPKQLLAYLNQYASHIIAVRGNCESEVDQMVLNFPCMATYSTLFVGNHKVFMTHGHHYDPENLPPLDAGSIFLSGHTHIPVAYQKEDLYILNPGSLALPKQQHPHTYGILDDQGFTIFTKQHEMYMHLSF